MRIFFSLLGWLCFAGLLAGGATATVLLWGYSYEQFTDLLLHYTNKTDWRDYFQRQVFPSARFQYARWLSLAAWLPASGLGIWWLRRRRQWTAAAAHTTTTIFYILRTYCRHLWTAAPRWEKHSLALLATLLLARTLYTCYDHAIQYDEAWTYNHFISKGFLVCLLSPNNNHILYTLLACLTDYLPIEHRFALRLPAMLAAWASCLALYLFLRQAYGNKAALVALAFWSFSPAMYFYALYARAYSLTYLFHLLQLWALYALCFGLPRRRYGWMLALSIIGGLYSSPAYLYALVGGIAAMFLSYDWRTRWRFLLPYLLFSGVAVVLLYAPFLLTNGFTVLSDAATGEAQPLPSAGRFYDYIGKILDICFTGQRWNTWSLLWLGTAALLALFVHQRRHRPARHSIIWILLHLWMPLWLYAINGVEAPWRLWLFLLLFWAWASALFAHYYLSHRSTVYSLLLAVLLGATNWLWSSQHYFIGWSYWLDKSVQRTAQIILTQQPPITECYCFPNYDKPLLEYYAALAQQPLRLYRPFPQSKDYRPFDTRRYPCLLWDKDDLPPLPAYRDIARQYTPFYEDYRIRLLR